MISVKKKVNQVTLSAIYRFFIFWTTLFFISFTVAFLVLLSFPLVWIFDRTHRRFLHSLATWWGRLILLCNPWWKIVIKGHLKLPANTNTVIFVSNHQSQIDIMALYKLPFYFRWFAKESLFKIPIFGWAMSATGYIPIARGSRESAKQALTNCKKLLKQGVSLWFFPEGTRVDGGKLGNFKLGAFRLADESKVPIVPVTLSGCYKLLPKGNGIPHPSRAYIYLHEPIYPKGDGNYVELADKVRVVIESQLEMDQ